MKTRVNHFLTLAKLMIGWRIVFALLLAVYFFFTVAKTFLGSHHQHSFESVIMELMVVQMIICPIYYHSVFQTDLMRAIGGGFGRVVTPGPWELFFSQAISRRAIFATRSSYFLFFIFLYWGGFVVRACLHPDLQLNQSGTQHPADFDLANFPGAFSVTNINGCAVVLPHGAILAVGTGLLISFVGLLIYQLCMELIQNRWFQIGIWIGLIALIFVFPSQRTALWILSNPLLACTGVIILTVAIQRFCCDRFICKETL